MIISKAPKTYRQLARSFKFKIFFFFENEALCALIFLFSAIF